MAAFLRTDAGAPVRARLGEAAGGPVFATSDPPASRLGSGGGTANLLAEAWHATAAPGQSWNDWLNAAPKLVLHAGGESRRLPAYAAIGKLALPVPLLPGLDGQRLDQTLSDFQLPRYREVLLEAGASARVLVTSGDVWLEFESAEIAPVEADFVGLGMRVPPEIARDFGVFFVRRSHRRGRGLAQEIAFFLQKPAPERIHAHLDEHDSFVDTGMWLLSARAVNFLMTLSGWDAAAGRWATPDGLPRPLDLYGEIGPALGRHPASDVPAAWLAAGFADLTAAVVPLEETSFHHLGSTRQVFDSLRALARQGRPRARWIVNSPATWEPEAAGADAKPIWLDTCLGPVGRLGGWNLAVGWPEGAAPLELPEGVGIEVRPASGGGWWLRVFGLDDPLRGAAGGAGTILGQPAAAWLAARGLTVDATTDVFDLPIYPWLPAAAALDASWILGFTEPNPDPAWVAQWQAARRTSGRAWADGLDYAAWATTDATAQGRTVEALFTTLAERPVPGGFTHDGDHLAAVLRATPGAAARVLALADAIRRHLLTPSERCRFEMILALIDPTGADTHRATAFQVLRESIVQSSQVEKVSPGRALKEDQIVWARSPIRFDLAGGWSDTPPFCFDVGGAVVNVAANLNGQPPVQVFVRPTSEPTLRIHSIDLGLSETVSTYDEIATFRDPQSGFSLAKAAYALAGFHPEFHLGAAPRTLAEQLTGLGGGLEISLLCAVPKGSGLGTSSILAATLLGALNRAGALGWDTVEIYRRVLAMEQLLTTGGGWQDQAGALFPGLKLIETQPGLAQDPTVRYLPGFVFGPSAGPQPWLLYYTGVTRLAKNILQDVVTRLFLGRSETRALVGRIKGNARHLFEALQRGDAAATQRAVDRSWRLNRSLDAGTSTAEIDALLASAGDDLVAAKLLGAGGGGFLLLAAKDAEAARRLRARWEATPPNPRARFVDFNVADQGLVVTVS